MTLNMRRRILVITTGSTPQVVTETVHALATGTPAWIPDRLVLATTQDAAQQFRDGRVDDEGNLLVAPLLGEDGKLAALSKFLEIQLPKIDVVVPRDASGKAIPDIRSEAQVAAFAETLMQIVAEATADMDSELHVSLAGGRKTMSFLAGQVMSLLGRPQDRLSHVLVEPAALESASSGFWWPGDGSPGADSAIVRLHLIPFLRVRAWLDDSKLQAMAAGGFVEAVEMANMALGNARVTIDLACGQLIVAGMVIPSNARQLAVLALVMIAKRRGMALSMERTGSNKADGYRYLCLDGDRHLASRTWAWLHAAASFADIHRDHLPVGFRRFDDAIAEQMQKLENGEFETLIAQPVARLRKTLDEKLPAALAARLLAPGRGLDTLLEPELITILVPADLSDHPDLPPEVTPTSAV